MKRNFSNDTWETLAEVYEARIEALEKECARLKEENERITGELYMTRLMGSNQDALEAHIATQNFIHSKLWK
jgi:predicted nuclease with TOPRIM domain